MPKVDYDINIIKELLPHRPPFLFVDRIIDFVPGKKILATRTLREDETHFKGHFPGNPIMPGVLIAEALAQTSGLLLALTAKAEERDLTERLFYLAKADVKWTKPARPGQTLTLESKHVRTLEPLVAFRVRAFTEKDDVAQGMLTLAQVA